MEIQETPKTQTKQKRDRYEMHKYWGKKPSNDLNSLITKYSKEGDILLDPFSGYGVFCCEAYLMSRNIICNDLNPISIFIQEQLFIKGVNFKKLDLEFNTIVKKLSKYVFEWFRVGNEKDAKIAINVLRDKNDNIIKCKYKSNNQSKLKEYVFSDGERKSFRERENIFKITEWFPDDYLIENSRISAKKGMKIKDLFTKRTLACHSKLYELINAISSGPEKGILLLAFTSNLANCSKLVPPIKSRGDMAPGAWMTGFYWGEYYLENNVLHYFKNRYLKAFKGKRDFLSCFDTILHSNGRIDLEKVDNISGFSNNTYGYLISKNDTRDINLPSESIDYIFTDPPYGDSVPYFEQSIIWNSWLKIAPDYDKEIVVSNSHSRKKNIAVYKTDIEKAISEIYRVLKINKYFSITFHSLSGSEWNGLTNACVRAGFQVHEFTWLTQKTFTPRQLNRAKSVKGDVLITFRKPNNRKQFVEYDISNTNEYFEQTLENIINNKELDTNTIFMEIVNDIFERHIVLADVNFFKILSSKFNFNNNLWSKKHA